MNDNIKHRVKKLLALSHSTNEHEAALALDKARELMEAYNLSEEDCTTYISEVKCLKSEPLWRFIVASSVAWLNGVAYVHILRINGDVYRFYGRESDVFIAREMNNYLIRTIERLTKKNVRKNAKKTFRDSYKYGMAKTLYFRIRESGALYSWANKRDAQIQKLNAYIENMCTVITDNSVKPLKINRGAVERGMRDGYSIGLHRQTSGHSIKQLTGTGQ